MISIYVIVFSKPKKNTFRSSMIVLAIVKTKERFKEVLGSDNFPDKIKLERNKIMLFISSNPLSANVNE